MRAEIDSYSDLDSWLHRWDPRWKLGGFLGLIVLTIVERPGMRSAPLPGKDLLTVAASLLLALVLVASSRIPIGAALRTLRPALWLLLALLVVLPLMVPGDGIRLGSIRLSTGFLVALVIVTRALTIVLLVFLAFQTTRFDLTMKALHSLRVPAPIVAIALFSYRFLFAYFGQYRRMRLAMRSRGFRSRLDRHTLRTAGNGLGMLLVGSVERIERAHGAMKARGYSGNFRTLEEFRTRPADVVYFAAFLLAGTGLLAGRLV